MGYLRGLWLELSGRRQTDKEGRPLPISWQDQLAWMTIKRRPLNLVEAGAIDLLERDYLVFVSQRG